MSSNQPGDPFFKALGWDIDNEQGYIPLIMAVLLVNICATAETARPPAIKQRVFVLTDLSNEPHDE